MPFGMLFCFYKGIIINKETENHRNKIELINFPNHYH